MRQFLSESASFIGFSSRGGVIVQIYTRAALDQALQHLNLPRGALLLIHTALYAPGRMEGVPLAEISSRLYASLRRRIGAEATLVVPTFHGAFARGEVFDRQYTPATGMGSFAEYLRLLPNSRRSPHALHSLAADGPLAEAIATRDTPSAFGEGSPFDSLIAYDARLLMFGCSVEVSCMIRWAEERVGVPYRRWLICRGRYVDAGIERMRSFHTYAGEDGREPALCLTPVKRLLLDRGQLQRADLGSSSLESCRARDFVAAATEILHRDPRALLTRRSTDGARRP